MRILLQKEFHLTQHKFWERLHALLFLTMLSPIFHKAPTIHTPHIFRAITRGKMEVRHNTSWSDPSDKKSLHLRRKTGAMNMELTTGMITGIVT